MAQKKFDEFLPGGDMKIGDQPVGLRSTDLLNNYIFDFPGAGLRDGDGNYMLQYATVGSFAVNYAKITNSSSAMSVKYGADGSDSNISIEIEPKNDGVVIIDSIQWPESPGNNGEALVTDGVGVTSFGAIGVAGGGTGLTTANESSIFLSDNTSTPFWSSPMVDGEIIIGSTGLSPNKTTLSGGNGINIINGPGSITVENTSPSPLDTIVVNELSDLPDPVSGVRNLGNFAYYIASDLTDSNQWARPASGPCAIISNSFGRSITYTGTGSFLIDNTPGTSGTITLENIVFTGPGATVLTSRGLDLFGVSAPLPGVPGPGSLIKMINVIFQDFNTNCRFENFALEAVQCDWFRGSINLHMINGFFFLTSCFIANDQAGLEGPATMIKVENGAYGVDQVAGCINVTFDPKSTDTIFDIDPAYIGSVRVVACETKTIPANFFAAGGLDNKDDKIQISTSNNLPSSLKIAESSLSVPQIVTINVVNQIEPVAGGNWVEVSTTQRFSCDNNGICTYNSTYPDTFLVTMVITMTNVGGGTDAVEVCPIINGVPDNTKCQSTTSPDPTSITMVFTISLQDTNTIQIGVRNTTDTSNINVSSARLIITKVG